MAPNTVVVTLEKPENISLIEVNGSKTGSIFQEKQKKSASPKQFTWVLLLKAHRVLACIPWLALSIFTVFGSIRKRIATSDPNEEDPKYRGRLYIFIKAFLAVSVIALVIEVFAYFNEWDLSWEVQSNLVQWGYLGWLSFRVDYVAPVYETSIAAACQLDWPKDRFLVQVLDDSDDELLQHLIRDEVMSWKEKGVNIVYRHRFIRTGYKAGNLKSAMACDYGKPDIALVQARWSFVNKDENLLTRLQNINLCFHFEVEQQVNGLFLNFFGFNGTAGVWRIKALEDSGGWLERTTVEDMDIAKLSYQHGLCYVPISMSILNILPAPKSFPFLMPYLLFENTMSVTKFNAMVSGLFQLGSAYEWVVTKKTGRASESDLLSLAERESKPLNEEKIQRRLSESGLEMLGKLNEQKEQKTPVVKKKKNRIFRKELALAFLLLTAAARSLLSAQGIHFYYLLFQGLSFLVVGLDLIGEQVS
ncbi:hypothetical protein DH2020_009412 [Rehmannia glutinosa]|uniref:Uncharacterized protein n=1 Tax=Rehmannia glutinosa TaxID=99300 RepID=A0ABR0X997_REHGL